MPTQSQILGLPVLFGTDVDGIYTTVTFQSVFIYGSPLVVVLDPPVATIEQASLPATLALIAALAGAPANGLQFT